MHAYSGSPLDAVASCLVGLYIIIILRHMLSYVLIYGYTISMISLAWPDRFFPFLFVVAEKRVWSGLQTHLVLTPSNVLINYIISSQKHEMWQTSLDSKHCKKYSCFCYDMP